TDPSSAEHDPRRRRRLGRRLQGVDAIARSSNGPHLTRMCGDRGLLPAWALSSGITTTSVVIVRRTRGALLPAAALFDALKGFCDAFVWQLLKLDGDIGGRRVAGHVDVGHRSRPGPSFGDEFGTVFSLLLGAGFVCFALQCAIPREVGLVDFVNLALDDRPDLVLG